MGLEVVRSEGREIWIALLLELAGDISSPGKTVSELHDLLNSKNVGRDRSRRPHEFRSKVSIFNYLKELVAMGYVERELERTAVKIIPSKERKYETKMEYFTREVGEYRYLMRVKHSPRNLSDIFLFFWKNSVDLEIGFDQIRMLMKTPWYLYECSYISGSMEIILNLPRDYSVPSNVKVNDYLWNDPTMLPSVDNEEVLLNGPFSTFQPYSATFHTLITTFPEVAHRFLAMVSDGNVVNGNDPSDRYYNYLKRFFPRNDSTSNAAFFNILYGDIVLSHAVFPEHYKLYYTLGIPFGDINASRLKKFMQTENSIPIRTRSRPSNSREYKLNNLISEISRDVIGRYDDIKANPDLIGEWCQLDGRSASEDELIECLIEATRRTYSAWLEKSDKKLVLTGGGKFKRDVHMLIRKKVKSAIKG